MQPTKDIPHLVGKLNQISDHLAHHPVNWKGRIFELQLGIESEPPADILQEIRTVVSHNLSLLENSYNPSLGAALKNLAGHLQRYMPNTPAVTKLVKSLLHLSASHQLPPDLKRTILQIAGTRQELLSKNDKKSFEQQVIRALEELDDPRIEAAFPVPKNISPIKRFRALYPLILAAAADEPEKVTSLKELALRAIDRNFMRFISQVTKLPKGITTAKAARAWFKGLPQEMITKVRSLNLSKCALRILPEEIGLLKSLQVLNLNHNKLRQLPPQIGELRQLKTLQCAHNGLRDLPQSLINLPLEILNLNHNHFTAIPQSLCALRTLKRLILSENRIKKIPEAFRNLSDLKILSLSNNRLFELPSAIFGLTELTGLHVASNLLEELPEEMQKLLHLEILDCAGNQLTTLPLSMKNMQITDLKIGYNPFPTVPAVLALMRRLRFLNCEGLDKSEVQAIIHPHRPQVQIVTEQENIS